MLETIMKLIDAGYTKDEISQLMALEKPAEDKPAEDSEPAEDKPAEDSKPAEDKPAETKDADAKINGIQKQLDYLIAKMNYEAVKGTKQPENTHKETTEDILASIIINNKGEKKDGE
jgi:hypothetical protein